MGGGRLHSPDHNRSGRGPVRKQELEQEMAEVEEMDEDALRSMTTNIMKCADASFVPFT